MNPTLDEMVEALIASGDYRVARRFQPRSEYNPPDETRKFIGAVVDVETTGTNTDHDKIIELGLCLFEFSSDGRIYRVIGSWDWFEDPGVPIPPEVVKLTGITDEMVAGRSIDTDAVTAHLTKCALVIAHNASFDRPLLERRVPIFCEKAWACSMSDIDWTDQEIRSSKLEYIAYRLGFFHAGHRASADCLATVHALAQPLPITGRLALGELLENARLASWRIWARDSKFEKKDVLKARRYIWSSGEMGRPKCWFRDVQDADKPSEVAWLQQNVLGERQPAWALRITARDRYSARCWDWGQPVSGDAPTASRQNPA